MKRGARQPATARRRTFQLKRPGVDIDLEPPEEAVAVLREALQDEEPLVREHAAWALGSATAP